jgi:hypothetical protein
VVPQHLVDQRRELDSPTASLLGSAPTPTQLHGRTHGRSLCHKRVLVLLVALVGMVGCASKVGWSPTDPRACSPKDPAQVCSVRSPDYGHVLEVGDTKVLPGECAVLDDAGRGGLLRIETRDPRGERRGRWIRAPRSTITILQLEEDGSAKVIDRHRCPIMLKGWNSSSDT